MRFTLRQIFALISLSAAFLYWARLESFEIPRETSGSVWQWRWQPRGVFIGMYRTDRPTWLVRPEEAGSVWFVREYDPPDGSGPPPVAPPPPNP
jgi:hypothetical protein